MDFLSGNWLWIIGSVVSKGDEACITGWVICSSIELKETESEGDYKGTLPEWIDSGELPKSALSRCCKDWGWSMYPIIKSSTRGNTNKLESLFVEELNGKMCLIKCT